MSDRNITGPLVMCLGTILCALLLFGWGIINGVEVGRKAMQTEAIEKGYAEYNATTGNWQWKESR